MRPDLLESLQVEPFRHGDDKHSSTSTSHLYPAYPAAHTQLNVKTLSTHVPPFTHGYDAHSFTSISQWEPAHPLGHVQLYCTTHAASLHLPSLHVAPFMHGNDEHSAMLVHVFPPSAVSYPTWHTHSCLLTPTWTHFAVFLSQSFSFKLHASTSCSQNLPAHEDEQVHVNLSTKSVHVEPFLHGDDKQSSSFVSQLYPL